MQKLVFSNNKVKKKKRIKGKFIHLTQRLWALRDIFVQSKNEKKKYNMNEETNTMEKKSSDSDKELHGRTL